MPSIYMFLFVFDMLLHLTVILMRFAQDAYWETICPN